MTQRIAILCPSRGRPERCRRMLESALSTTRDAQVMLYVDQDDPRAGDYEPLSKMPRVMIRLGAPVGRGRAINDLVARSEPFDLYLIVSDDITFLRDGWEDQVREAMDSFGDGIGCVHLSSETGERYVNWLCVSRKWIDTLGWINEPSLNMFCQDTVVQILAQALGRIRMIEPQVLRHDCLAEHDTAQRFSADASLFLWYCARSFGRDLAKLKSVMQ